MTWRVSRAWFSAALGIGISVFFLWLAVKQVEFNDMLSTLKSANYGYIIISAAALAVGIALRSLRWHIISGTPPESLKHFYHATTAGVLSNMLLPARAGEVVRIFALTRLTGVRLANPIASAVLDRLMDIITILLCAGALFLFLPSYGLLDQWLSMIVLVGTLITAGAFAAAAGLGFVQRLTSRVVERWLSNWKVRPEVFFAELQVESRRVLSSSVSLRLGLVALLILLVDLIAVGSQVMAFHLEVPLLATPLLWTFLVIGSMLPSAPGYIGVYQTAAIWALSFFAVPPSSAVALAIVLQAASYLVAFAMAGPGFWKLLKSWISAQRANQI
ncbi:MAG: flippase-like domain-containing protein [Alphaproteobacteria bacterium]|nr:flippase-like domain-containing protein [Alphaproteobacteria bacterium]